MYAEYCFELMEASLGLVCVQIIVLMLIPPPFGFLALGLPLVAAATEQTKQLGNRTPGGHRFGD